MPFFSIIIPTYNRAKIISPTILSVINQKFTNWELIIVDDGGKDNTKEVVDGFNDDRIIYFWKENGERGAARNYGVKQAKGKYVFFLDSDDLIYPNHLQHAFEKLNELNQPEFFHSRYEEVFTNKMVQVERLHQNTIWKTIQKQNKFACQFFLRNDIAIEIPFSENRNLKIGEDWLVILQVGIKYPLNISNQVTSAIIQHPNRSMQMSSHKDVVKSRDLILEALKEGGYDRLMLNNIYFELTSLSILSAVLEKQKKQAVISLIKLFFKDPIKICKQRRTLAIIKHLFK